MYMIWGQFIMHVLSFLKSQINLAILLKNLEAKKKTMLDHISKYR